MYVNLFFFKRIEPQYLTQGKNKDTDVVLQIAI